MVKAVIFDIDGTIIDSVGAHIEAWRRTFARFGKEVSDEEIRRHIGEGSDDMPYWRKFTLYVIIAVSVTFGIAYLLGSLGRVINIIFSFTAGYVGMIIARRILS